MKDYYHILGVADTAGEDEIRRAYKKLAKRFHPDRNQGSKEAEEKFKEISEAYEVLSNAEKRKKYDTIRRFGSHSGFSGSAQSEFDFSEFFRNFDLGSHRGSRSGRSFADMLDEMFFGESSSGHRSERGHDLEAEVTISFEKAVRGGDVEFTFQNGTRRTLKVKIPPGINDGEQIRLRGQGHPSASRPGDLILTVRVTPDPLFSRKELDIFTDVTVNLAQAILGSTVRVKTAYGDRLDVKIPPATQPGTMLKLNRLGIKGRSGVGDMYITVKVELPKSLGRRQRELFEDFARQAGLEW